MADEPKKQLRSLDEFNDVKYGSDTAVIDEPVKQVKPAKPLRALDTFSDDGGAMNRYLGLDNQEFGKSGTISDSDLHKSWAIRGKIGMLEYGQRFQSNLEITPFLSWGALWEPGKIMWKASKLKNNEYGVGEEKQKDLDYREVRDFATKLEELHFRGLDMGAKGWAMTSESSAFFLEFISSAGIFPIVKKAGKQITKTSVRKSLKDTLKGYAASTAKAMAKEAARTGTFFAHRVALNYMDKRLTAELGITDKGEYYRRKAEDSPYMTAYKAFTEIWIENITEVVGGELIGKGLGAIGRRLPKGLVNVFVDEAKKGKFKDVLGKSWKFLTKGEKALAWNGILAEFGEERLGDLMKVYLTDALPAKIQGKEISGAELFDKTVGAFFPDAEQAMLEIGMFTVFGGISYSGSKLKKYYESKGMTEPQIKAKFEMSSETERDQLVLELEESGEIKPVAAQIETSETIGPLDPPVTTPTATEIDPIKFAGDFKSASEEVDGRVVRDSIPNQASISATLNDFTIEPGVKEVPLDVFDPVKFVTKRDNDQVKRLIDEISESGELNPLIVVVDSEGAYVLEGGHRLAALQALGAKSLPAMVVIDHESVPEAKKSEVGGPETSTKPLDWLEQKRVDELKAATPAPTTTEAKVSGRGIQGLSKAEGARLRQDTGLEGLDKPVRRKWETALKEADAGNAETIAGEVLATDGRALSDTEHASLVVRAAELANKYEALLKQGLEQTEAGSPNAQSSFAQADAISAQIDILSRASEKAGTEAGRALSIRRMMINRESFKLADIVQKASQRKGKALTQGEKIEFTKLVKKFEALEANVKTLQDNLEKAEERASRAEAEKTVKKGKPKHSRKADKANIKKDRDAIKAQLKALGMRVNDISGVSVEASIIIGKLAGTYVREGALTLDEVVKNIRRDIPDVSTRDIWDSISGRGRESRKKVKSEIEKRLTSIKKQADLLSQIEDAAKGVFDAPKTVNTNKEVKALRKQLNSLRDEAMRGARGSKRLDDIIRKIDEIRDDIEAGVIRKKQKKVIDPAPIAEAKKKLSELRSLIDANATLKDLMEQLKTGKYKIQARREVRIVSSELEQARAQVAMAKKEIRQRIQDQAPMTFMRAVSEVAQFARTIKATADRSGVLRQAAWMASRMPVKATKAVVEAERAAWSEDYYHLIDGQLRNIADEHGMIELGLELTETGGSLVSREEDFASDFAERIPALGAVIKNSNRHMVTYLNMMRVESMKRFLVDNPNASKEQKQAYARFITVGSGRGDLGKFDVMLGGLGKLFFAPRFGISRFQVAWIAGKEASKAVKSGDWLVAKEIGKDFGAYAGSRLAIMAILAAAFSGDDENYIGWDWNDADFGKVVIGPMRLDMWSGHAQPLRLLMSVADGAVSPHDKDFDPYGDIGRFLQYKLSPAVSTTMSLVSGKDFLGREQARSEILMKALMPIIVETALETIADGRSAEVIVGTLAAEIVGIGVGVYDPSQSWKRGTRTWTDDMKAAYEGYEPGRASTSTKALNTDEWTDAEKSRMDRYYWNLLGERTATLLEVNPNPSRKYLEKLSKYVRDRTRSEFQR